MSAETSLDFILASKHFVELIPSPSLRLDLRYATENNFVGKNMYGDFNRAFLHRIAAEKLYSALTELRAEYPHYGFLIYDALRPRSVQRILWQHVVNTPNEKYLANPDKGSLHNFGFAVDLTIFDERGEGLDMGAGFDDFRPIAQPQHETEFLNLGELHVEQLSNRRILRRAMENSGFKQLPHEWWHFDALDKAQAWAHHQIVE